MILLTFAHRPEARAFLHFFKELKSTSKQSNLYLSNDNQLGLLITGEGYFPAAIELTHTISNHKDIRHIINLGVAGALTPDQEVGDIYMGRTSYLAKSGELKKMEFKSFELKRIVPEIIVSDIITSPDRVLNPEEKSFYANFGELIDRELWGLSNVAHKFNIPISSVKIISDGISQENFCEIVKLKADKFSNDLLHFFNQYILPNINNSIERHISNSANFNNQDLGKFLYSIPNLFFSTAQKNLVKKYEKKITLTGTLIEKINTIIDTNSQLRPKDLTKIILELLEMNFAPETFALAIAAKNEVLAHNTSSIKFFVDPIFETSEIKFSGSISNEEDKLLAIEKLQKLPIIKWDSIISGEENV